METLGGLMLVLTKVGTCLPWGPCPGGCTKPAGSPLVPCPGSVSAGGGRRGPTRDRCWRRQRSRADPPQAGHSLTGVENSFPLHKGFESVPPLSFAIQARPETPPRPAMAKGLGRLWLIPALGTRPLKELQPPQTTLRSSA